MPKLNLDKSFIKKLNDINRNKSISKIKLTQKPNIPSPKFKRVKKYKKQKKQINKEKEISEEEISDTIQPNTNSAIQPTQPNTNSAIQLKRLVVENISDVGMMWDSFDDNIKKIVLNEIIEKYYFYKNWKLNIVSFVFGFIFAFFIFYLLQQTCD